MIDRRSFLKASAANAALLGASIGTVGAGCAKHPGAASIPIGVNPFRHGVASGDPLADRVILWTRVSPFQSRQGEPVETHWWISRDALGLDVVADTFEATTAAGYWPGAQPMTMKVVAERGTRRMLGAQIVGGDGAAKRIDALAMALWNEMTVDELINVDLSYAPPFSGVWDPVLVGARKLRAILGDP